jgi:hypothetical protein
MLCFATLFDKNYLSRGLALLSSMHQHIPIFRLYVLCLDIETENFLNKKNDSNIALIRLADLEEQYPELMEAVNNRSRVEFYFTLSPVLPLYILEIYPEINLITTLDADIYFFSDPSPVLEELAGKSILISPHRFPPHLKGSEAYGLYNVSFQAFRRDENGFACLRWWKEKCIEWCYDRLEENRFADQKYLDQFPHLFEGVTILKHTGAAVAPWNIGTYAITQKHKKVFIGSEELIFYHFHYLRFIQSNLIKHNLDQYGHKATPTLTRMVYKPYIAELTLFNKQLKQNTYHTERSRKKTSKNDFRDQLIFGGVYWFISKYLMLNIRLEKPYQWYKNLKNIFLRKALL